MLGYLRGIGLSCNNILQYHWYIHYNLPNTDFLSSTSVKLLNGKKTDFVGGSLPLYDVHPSEMHDKSHFY